MARKYKVTCPYCEKSFYREDEEYEHYKNRYYHKKCYCEINKENIEKQELEEYIKKLFNVENISPLIKKQISDYHDKDKYNYSYSGIKKTLQYFFFVKKNDIRKSKGIGIVPFVYLEASQYYYELYLVELNNKNIDIENKIIDIVVKKPVREPIRNIKELEL